MRGKPVAVALVINSPGGSPVQSSLIGARIRRLAEEKNVPVYAFVEDVAASGGYRLASAADEIWIDPGSVLGSIGVISAGFGAHELISRNGIERRLYTAGKSKSLMDPFSPEKDEDVTRLKAILEQLHDVFIEHVKSRRGDKLVETDELFTGEVWLGNKAVEQGLADGVGHLVPKDERGVWRKGAVCPLRPTQIVVSAFGDVCADGCCPRNRGTGCVRPALASDVLSKIVLFFLIGIAVLAHVRAPALSRSRQAGHTQMQVLRAVPHREGPVPLRQRSRMILPLVYTCLGLLILLAGGGCVGQRRGQSKPAPWSACANCQPDYRRLWHLSPRASDRGQRHHGRRAGHRSG